MPIKTANRYTQRRVRDDLTRRTAIYNMSVSTTDATATDALIDGVAGASRVEIPAGSNWTGIITYNGGTTSTLAKTASGTRVFNVKNVAGTVTVTQAAATAATTGTPTNFTVAAVTEDVGGVDYVKVQVTGDAATNADWFLTLTLVGV